MTDGRRGIGVILLSYNRPKMLELAYRSIANEDAIILVDDGSDTFDPEEWANEHAGITARVFATRRSIDERMSTPSLGRLINGALLIAYQQLKLECITYLCDDDLFMPNWLTAVEQAFHDNPEVHVVRGRWRSFDDPLDGDPMSHPGKSRPTPLDARKMTTGNFAHRMTCYEEGLRWSEETIAVHDDTFLWNMIRLHKLPTHLGLPVLAGYRREHNFNMANYTAHALYSLGADKVLERGALE